MHVKKDKADRLLELTSQKYLDRNINRFVDKGYMDGYEELLKNIAEKSQYNEGEKITNSDLSRIKNAVVATLDGMRKMMVEQPLTLEEIKAKKGEKEFERILSLKDNEKQNAIREIEKEGRLSQNEQTQYDPFGAIIAVNDYMYAVAMKSLGCPDIPESFGIEMQNAIKNIANRAEFEMKKDDFEDTAVVMYYETQRGKSAKQVSEATVEVKNLIVDKKALPFNVAQYASEYYALKKRQEGHGKWWIFFHKKENEERTKLLADMEKTLKTFLKDGDELDKLDSIRVAEFYNKNNIESRANKAFEDGIAKRSGMPSEFIEDKPTSTERADKEKSEPNKDEIAFEDEMRMPMKFGEEAFAESKPITVAWINKVNDKIVSEVVYHDSKDKEVDLSNFVPKI